ncbi:hypothetical protein NDU88_006844 [Pleurodeles waltl]|uniref:Uncharacterized protein n=1 Tax=Pleurodeles waltl TaxID=8319 RepID=A0AAV7PJI2_PLEWA|nr:hypothetical protein NDU88_006844 [Pleurodeles waltl]
MQGLMAPIRGLAWEWPREEALPRLEVGCGHPFPAFFGLLVRSFLAAPRGYVPSEPEWPHQWVHRPAGPSGVVVWMPMALLVGGATSVLRSALQPRGLALCSLEGRGCVLALVAAP